MYLGNAMLLVLNLPLIGMWVQVLRIPYPILFPLILLFCVIGVYAPNNSIFEIWLMIAFGIVGYLAKKLEYDMPSLVLAFILGPMLENALRHAMMLFDGDLFIFITRPYSAMFLTISFLLLLSTT